MPTLPTSKTTPSRLLALLPLALLLAPSACGRPARAASQDDEGTVLVRLAPFQRGPVERPIRAAGVVAAEQEWDLSFKVGGVLARVLVDEGALVRRGQVLAELDTTELAAGAAQAREGVGKARRDAERAAALAEADAAPRVAAEDARTGVAVAEASLAAAEFNLRRARLVAPDDGWIDRRQAEPGEVVAPGRAVLHLSGRGRGFVVRAALAERDILGLAPGVEATVHLDARPGDALRGRVTEVARSASRGTGTYDVEIELPDRGDTRSRPPSATGPRDHRAGGRDEAAPPLALLAGMTAKVEIPRSVPAAGAVPLAAVVGGDGDTGAVFAIEGGRARLVPVRIAFLHGDRAVLARGIEGVGEVVTDGAARLRDGAAVHVAE